MKLIKILLDQGHGALHSSLVLLNGDSLTNKADLGKDALHSSLVLLNDFLQTQIYTSVRTLHSSLVLLNVTSFLAVVIAMCFFTF